MGGSHSRAWYFPNSTGAAQQNQATVGKNSTVTFPLQQSIELVKIVSTDAWMTRETSFKQIRASIRGCDLD